MNTKKLFLIYLIFFAVLSAAFVTFVDSTSAHDVTHPQSMQAVLPGQLAEVGWFDELAAPEFLPEKATNCDSYIRPSRTSAIGTCYNWNGIGSYYYQVAALAFDGCNRWVWFYGNVAWPYIRNKTANGKQSLVYTPPGTWKFYDDKVIAWAP